jgi:hypothetical protein|nr:MAG TPA: hypothetical protein [Caudoviricetes sp.]
MSYKTELQELQRKLVKIKDKKKQAQKAFFEIAGEQIQEDFPFRLIQESSFGTMIFSFSESGKFKCSKTITYDLLFLDNITFRFYHEKGQTEKVEKAKQTIKKLYEGEDDERD